MDIAKLTQISGERGFSVYSMSELEALLEPSPTPLKDRLAELHIPVLDAEEVTKYKRNEKRKAGPRIVDRLLRLVDIMLRSRIIARATFSLALGSLVCILAGIAALYFGVEHALSFLIGSFTLFVMMCMFPAGRLFLDGKVYILHAFWTNDAFMNHEQTKKVPEYVRTFARYIRWNIPQARLRLDILRQNCEIVDPILYVRQGDEVYALLVWDEGGNRVFLPYA